MYGPHSQKALAVTFAIYAVAFGIWWLVDRLT